MGSDFGQNLVDKLSPKIDRIRGKLYAKLGVRQHVVTLVKRAWSGARRGEGTPTIVSEVEIEPTPVFQEALQNAIQPGGREEEGAAVLTEVSLAYDEADLTGGELARNEEFYYRVEDAHGQHIRTRYYTPSRPVRTDREGDIAWRVDLRRIQLSAPEQPEPPEPPEPPEES